MTKPITIRIYKTHGKKVPMSIWSCYVDFGKQKIGNRHAITDISKGLENPLYCISIADQMIETMNNAINESEDRAWLGIPPKNLEILQSYQPKSSLLTKLKNKLRRK